jgi:hypothetical protein
MEKIKEYAFSAVLATIHGKTSWVPKKAGMAFILFRSEFKPYNDFQPDRQFNDYSELLKIVEEM